jgi:hypothetical protein
MVRTHGGTSGSAWEPLGIGAAHHTRRTGRPSSTALGSREMCWRAAAPSAIAQCPCSSVRSDGTGSDTEPVRSVAIRPSSEPPADASGSSHLPSCKSAACPGLVVWASRNAARSDAVTCLAFARVTPGSFPSILGTFRAFLSTDIIASHQEKSFSQFTPLFRVLSLSVTVSAAMG